MADAPVSKTGGETHVGSTPTLGIFKAEGNPSTRSVSTELVQDGSTFKIPAH